MKLKFDQFIPRAPHFILIFLSVQLFYNTSIAQEDRRNNTTRLVIATFNAEFMWDGIEPEEGRVIFSHKGSQTEAEEHMEEIAEVIIRSDADIVNLVEIENIEALTTLNDKFLLGRGYKPYLIKGKDTFTGQDVGLLTRIDPESMAIERWDEKGQSGSILKSVSKNYYTKLKVDKLKIAVIGLHFLSGPSRPDRKDKRQAQADAIVMLANDLKGKGYSLIILGDYNDFDGSSDAIDLNDNMPITNVLDRIRELDPQTDTDDLINVASHIQQNERYTAYWDRNNNNNVDAPQEFSSIDHILVSKVLADKIQHVSIPHDHDPRFVSDHFPVIVTLRLSDNDALRNTGVRIISLLPNPEGNENQNEQVTIKNFGSQTVDLAGWKIRDIANRVWTLDAVGNIQSNQEKVIKRNGQSMGMNNGGDTIELVDPVGNVLQTITYSSAEEGEIIETVQ